jgi:hypothetical protein
VPFPNSDTQFTKGNPGGPGRTAGYKHWSAELFKWLIETPHGDSKNPFIIDALIEYQKSILAGKGNTMATFMEQALPRLHEIDDILSNQKSRDINFMSYMIYRHCFDEQHQLLMTKKPMTVMIGGRRMGKTIALGALLDDRAIHHEKGVALYLGRTAKSAFEMIWKPVTEILTEAQVPFEPHISTQTIVLPMGTEIHVRGRSSREDVENLRGKAVFLGVVDEIQSDAPEKLRYIVRDILEPAGKDFEDSEIVLSGTPPRVPGNYAEELYLSDRKDIKRLNWNMSVNPHIPKSERDLEKTRKEKGFKDTDPTWQREYLGIVGSYDTDALVYRLGPGNYFKETDLIAWINSQPITDIFFAGGIDYGFDDQDSAVIILASESKGERFLISEYKGNRQSTQDFANNVKLGLSRVLSNPIFAKVPNKEITYFCDTEGLGKQLTFDLASSYGLPVRQAYQGQQDLMVEMQQDDIKTGRFKVRETVEIDGVKAESIYADECNKIVFKRDEVTDALTRRVDDEVYHGEEAKSVLYAQRYVWLRSRIKAGTIK